MLLRRNTEAVIVSIRDKIYLCDLNLPGYKKYIEWPRAQLTSALNLCASPVDEETLLDQLAERFPQDSLQYLRKLLADLIREQLLISDSGANQNHPLLDGLASESNFGKLVVGVCGAVAATTVPQLLFKLRSQLTNDIDVILTQSALKFVQPYGLELMSGGRVWCDPYEVDNGIKSPHIHLAESAKLLLIYPCSAHTIAKLANCTCEDLLSLTACSTRAPIVIVPAMNSAMWESPGIQRNLDQLRDQGIFIVEPGAGLEIGKRFDDENNPQPGGQGASERTMNCVLRFVAEYASETS